MDNPDLIRSARLWLYGNLTRPLTMSLVKLAAAGVKRYSLDNEAFDLFRQRGFYLLREHFYLPIPDDSELSNQLREGPSELVGLDMNDSSALDLLDNVFPRYNEEFRETFQIHAVPGSNAFYLINGSFMAVDAHAYYALIRHFRPKRIIEIGAGNSTRVASAACERNLREGGAAQVTAIDPFPMRVLKEGLPHVSRLVEDKVQNVPLELFTSLKDGDILFIDSTHVLREGGDVKFEYCEILPRLATGVIVHIHDISLPKPYPHVYFEKNRFYWNEQYVLQAFLAFNSRFQVLWPGNYMMTKYPERVSEVFPEYHAMREVYPMSEPSSFWMRVKAREV
jgi:hypothetical protein